MTAIAEDLDLSWVTFTDDREDEPCDWHDGQCSREAVALAVWDRPCDCHGPTDRLCAAHRDEVLATDRRPGDWFCNDCGATVRLLRIEPIR